MARIGFSSKACLALLPNSLDCQQNASPCGTQLAHGKLPSSRHLASSKPEMERKEVGEERDSSKSDVIILCACVLAQSLQPCPTLCDPMDCSPPSSSVHGILQARILVWVAVPYSRGSSPNQGSNPPTLCLLYWQMGSLPQAAPAKPRILCTCHHKAYHLCPLMGASPRYCPHSEGGDDPKV